MYLYILEVKIGKTIFGEKIHNFGFAIDWGTQPKNNF